MTRIHFRKVALEHFDVSLGTGLSKVAGKVFRIGHLGDTNDLTIIGALAGVEMGLGLAGVPHRKGGVQAAMDYFAAQREPGTRRGGVAFLLPSPRPCGERVASIADASRVRSQCDLTEAPHPPSLTLGHPLPASRGEGKSAATAMLL